MANLAPAFVTVSPSYIHPELVLPYSQASNAFETLPGGDMQVRLSDETKAVYFKRIDVRTRAAAGQSSYNNLPQCEIIMSQFSTPTYLQQVRAEYNHHDIAAFGAWGVPLPEAQRLAMQQAHNQNARVALLFGYNPANGEGLLNANGATAISLPADTNGNLTIATYDNGQMGLFLRSLVQAIKTRTNQMGIGREFVILGPQRALGPLEYNVVQLTQYQRLGAGTASTADMVKSGLLENGDSVTWGYDDTLQGKGANGTDAILIVMPQIKRPQAARPNTNVFATLTPGFDACTAQFCDMAAPREIPTPIAGGAIDVLSELRITSGLGVRPEAITVLSAAPF